MQSGHVYELGLKKENSLLPYGLQSAVGNCGRVAALWFPVQKMKHNPKNRVKYQLSNLKLHYILNIFANCFCSPNKIFIFSIINGYTNMH